jgi:hypothetical protein
MYLQLSPTRNVADQPVFTCFKADSTGFYYNRERRKWLSSKLEHDSHTFRIVPRGYVNLTGDYIGREPYDVFIDPGHVSEKCEEGFSRSRELTCDGKFYHLTFSASTKRFLLIFKSGYWDVPKGKDVLSDTPGITIGECKEG